MNLTNFAIIKGNGQINNGRIIYKAEETQVENKNDNGNKKNNLDLAKHSILIVKSHQKFSSGTIQFKLKFISRNTGVLLVLKSQDGTSVLCGPTLTEHKFAIANEDNTRNWRLFSLAGDLANYKENEELILKVDVDGSKIILYINNVALCEANFSIKDAPVEFRLCSDKDFEIYDIEIHTKKRKLFVVMQFSEEYNELYTDVIQPVASGLQFECVRADEFYSSTPILKDIIESITTSFAIIAEMTPDNPNVFYEIGYSHAIGKPTILLCDKTRTELPFDLSGFRTLFYENTIAGKKKIETSLRKYLETL